MDPKGSTSTLLLLLPTLAIQTVKGEQRINLGFLCYCTGSQKHHNYPLVVNSQLSIQLGAVRHALSALGTRKECTRVGANPHRFLESQIHHPDRWHMEHYQNLDKAIRDALVMSGHPCSSFRAD